MHIIVDVIIVLFVLLNCFLYAKKGLVLAVISSLSLIVAITLGVVLNAPVKSLVMTEKNTEKVESYCYDSLSTALKDVKDFDTLKKDVDDVVDSFEENTNIPASMMQPLRDTLSDTSLKSKDQVIREASHFFTDAFFTVAVFMGITIIIWILAGIIQAIIQRVRDADVLVLHQIDTIGGIILGIVASVAVIYIILFGIEIVATLGHAEPLAIFKQSFLGGWLYDHNLINYLLATFTK